MSFKDVEAPTSANRRESRPAQGRASRHGGLAMSATLSPAVAALAALLLHQFPPDRQVLPMTWVDSLAAWLHPYPLLLEALLAASLIAAAAQGAWWYLRPWGRHYSPLLAGAIVTLGLWDMVTVKFDWLPLPYFPGPDMVLAGMLDDRSILFDSTYRSLKLLLSGYMLGVVAGLVSGVLMGWFRCVRYWGMPVMKVVGPIPATAFVPLAMVLFADSFLAGTALIAMAVWFPVTMLTTSGIANVPVSYFDVARTLGAGRGFLIFRVAVPASLPNVFIGLFM